MTLNSLLVVSVIFLLFLLPVGFIVKAKINKKTSYTPDKDLWDHLSSEQPESIDYGTHRIRIHRNEGWELEPKIGNFAKPWLKPNTNTVIFYERGYIGGGGQAGWLMHRGLANHLRKEGVASAKILYFDSDSCQIELTVYDEYEPDIRKKQEEDFKARILKPYKPKKDWQLTFNMNKGFKPNSDVVLRYKKSNELFPRQEPLHEAIWVEDKSGKVLSAESYLEHDETVRTLRAFYSDLDVKVKKIEKVGKSFIFTLGVIPIGG